MKRPQITQGPWIPAGCGTLNDPVTGSPIATQVVEAQGWGRIFEVYDYSNEGPANFDAVLAIPAILSALESAYLRACQTVRDALHCEYEQSTVQELEAWRDEYKAALQSAGYVFDNSTAPAS